MEMYDISVIEGAEPEGLENGSAGASLEDLPVVDSLSLPLPRHALEEISDGASAVDGPDPPLDSLVRSCIAITWNWPWTVLYSVKTRKLFYFNETRQCLFQDLPHGTNLKIDATVFTTTNLRKLSSELLYRSLSLSRNESLAEVPFFSLCEKYFGASKLLHKMEEAQADRLYEKRYRLSGQSVCRRNIRRMFVGVSSDADDILSKSRTFPIYSSPPSRPVSSPSLSSSRPASTVGCSRIRVSVGMFKKGNDETYICFDSPHKASGVRSLIIEILSQLRDTENRVLRERVSKKHMLLATQRQRRLFEGIRAMDKSKKFSNTSHVERMQFSNSVEESPPTYSSLGDMFSTLSIERLRESEFAFEKSMSTPEHNEYLSLLNEASSYPNSIEAVLKLVIHLLRCNAYEAAVSFIIRTHGSISTYQLNDVEVSFLELLHKGVSSKFLGKYPKTKELQDLVSRHPEDSMLLAFIALHLDKVGYTDFAETHFLASLIRDPRNQYALRGYAHLLSVKKLDYLAAIKYLSRIGTESYHSDAPVAKLEMV